MQTPDFPGKIFVAAGLPLRMAETAAASETSLALSLGSGQLSDGQPGSGQLGRDQLSARHSGSGRRIVLRRAYAKWASRGAGLFLVRMANVSNWPFWFKMAFCPGLAVIALGGLGLQGILAAGQQADLIRAVVQKDLAIATRLSGDAARLQEINGRVYRLATLQAGKSAHLNVPAEADKLVRSAASLASDLALQEPFLAAGEDRAQLRQLVADVRTYRDAIEVFGSMLEMDFASAAEFIRPFDGNAQALLGSIGKVAGHAMQDANLRAVSSEKLSEHIRAMVIAVSIAASALLFGIAALLTRATVRSVHRIARAAESVARGNAAIDILSLARGDELGIIVRSLGVFQDNVNQIAFLAHHDVLTGLPNRALFNDRVQQALALLGRGTHCALLCLDLDRFKPVNDTLGHPIGDVLLRQVAERLQASVREGDTVARLGGDEFAVLQINLRDPSEADRLATRIINTLGAAFEVEGHRISIGASIGIAVAPNDGVSPRDLLKNADTALYGAKNNGRGIACFYEAAMNAALQARRALELGLREAIVREQFVVFYQPLVDARTHQVSSFEALVRWQHPERGLVMPDEFIPVAESTGLIGIIGQWVLRTACREAATWPDNIRIAVNLSALQFKDRNLVNSVKSALEDSGLGPERLELEITESILLTDNQTVLATLTALKEFGVRIAMDDFGTGYSSLSYLRSFPFDKVKIDRSFIKDLPTDKNALAIVRAIVGLSGSFGMQVTAEGVETDEQALQLALEDCNHLQGYLFSRPMPANMVEGLISQLSAQPQMPGAR
jgi:diguanylate cyclase (GGDEF)-like protein